MKAPDFKIENLISKTESNLPNICLIRKILPQSVKSWSKMQTFPWAVWLQPLPLPSFHKTNGCGDL